MFQDANLFPEDVPLHKKHVLLYILKCLKLQIIFQCVTAVHGKSFAVQVCGGGKTFALKVI